MARIGIVFGDTVIMSEQGACVATGQPGGSAISEQELVELVQRQHVQVAQCLSAARLLLGVANGLQDLELNPSHILESADLASIPTSRPLASVTPIRPSCYGLGA